MLSEKELRNVKLQQNKDAVVKTGKVVGEVGKVAGGVVFGLGKAAWGGLKQLGEMGQKSKRQGPVPNMSIDLGFGRNKAQRVHQSKLDKIFRRKPKRVRSRAKLRRRIRIYKERRLR